MTNRMTHSHHFLFQIQRSIVTTISNPTSIPANQTLSASATPPSQCTPTTKASAPTSSGDDGRNVVFNDMNKPFTDYALDETGMEQFYSDVLAVTDDNNAAVQKELSSILALGEPETAPAQKAESKPAAKPARTAKKK